MSTERDKAVETLLRAQKARTTGGLCLEPEVLAAWVDGGLTEQEIAQAEAHVADCSRCQALLATFAKVPESVPAAEPWWRRWRLELLVPLTAGVTAIALWVASPAFRSPAQPPAASFEMREKVQQAPPVERNERQQPAAAPPAQAPPRLSSPERFRDQAKQETAAVTAPEEALGRRKEAQEKLDRADEQKQAASADGRFAEPGKSAAVAVPPPAAAPVPASPPAAAPLAAPAGAAGSTNAAKDAAAESIAPRSGVIAGAADKRLAATVSSRALSQNAASRDIVSPNPAIRWRIGPAGSIQYSATSGASWQALTSGVAVDLTSGASPAPTVCWIVGRAGTVLLTIDGTRWQRSPFPENVDLIAVQAADSRSATVTAAGGRTFRTTDGGANWSLLQDF